MNTLISTEKTANGAPAAGRRVVDAPIRAFHALFAACFAGAWLTGDSEHWRLVHVTLGYTFIGLLIFRLIWGMAGPRQARLSLLWRKLRHLPDARALHQTPQRRAALQWVLTATVAGMLLSTLPLTLSGYAVYSEWGGEWLEEVHELMANGFLMLVGAHLMLLLVLSRIQRQNLARPMLTGRRAEPGVDLVKRNHGGVALALLLTVLAFWVWQATQGTVNAVGERMEQEDD